MSGERMAAEMAEQPGVLRALARRRQQVVAEVRAAVPVPPPGVVLVARGSSDHAAVYGRYALELAVRRPVCLAAPSLFTLYGADVACDGWLAVAVSQSGATPEIVTVFERLRAAGATGVAVTNDATSPLAQAADAVVDLAAGEELAVPATKTFTASVAAFAMLAEALGDGGWHAGDWEALPDQVAAVLADPRPPRRVAADLADAAGLVTVGRGFLYGVALEAALKLKETTSILAHGYSSADLRHGPIAVVEREFPVLAFTSSGRAAADMEDLVGQLAGRGARVHRVGDDAGATLGVPAGVSEPLAALPATVRAQQVAHALALRLGLDPDTPEGLSKVTRTR